MAQSNDARMPRRADTASWRARLGPRSLDTVPSLPASSSCVSSTINVLASLRLVNRAFNLSDTSRRLEHVYKQIWLRKREDEVTDSRRFYTSTYINTFDPENFEEIDYAYFSCNFKAVRLREKISHMHESNLISQRKINGVRCSA